MSKRGTFYHIIEIAKKKPEVRRAVDCYLDVSKEEIDNFKISGWIKNELKKSWDHVKEVEKNQAEGVEVLGLDDYASLMNERTQAKTEKKPYGTLNSDISIGKLSIDLEAGSPIMIINDARVKTTSGSIKLSDGDMNRLINIIDFDGFMIPGKFNFLVRDYIEKKHKIKQ